MGATSCAKSGGSAAPARPAIRISTKPERRNIGLRQGGHQSDRVADSHASGLQHARVEAAHAPARRGVVESFDARIVGLPLERFAVNMEAAARPARLGDFEQSRPGADLVPDADVAKGETASGQVLTQRAVEDRIFTGGEFRSEEHTS